MFTVTTYFMRDIVGDLAQLSKIFQKSSLPIHQQLQFAASTKRSIMVTYLSDEAPQFITYVEKWGASNGEDLTMNGQ